MDVCVDTSAPVGTVGCADWYPSTADCFRPVADWRVQPSLELAPGCEKLDLSIHVSAVACIGSRFSGPEN